MHPLLRILTATALVGCALNGPNSPADHPEPAPAGLHTPDAAHPLPAAIREVTRTASLRRHEEASPQRQSTAPLRAHHRLPQREVTRAVARQARRIIAAHGKDPFGTEIAFEAGGKTYIARIEQHYHPPGGEKRPWGPHPGVSVFVAGPSDDALFSAN